MFNLISTGLLGSTVALLLGSLALPSSFNDSLNDDKRCKQKIKIVYNKSGEISSEYSYKQPPDDGIASLSTFGWRPTVTIYRDDDCDAGGPGSENCSIGGCMGTPSSCSVGGCDGDGEYACCSCGGFFEETDCSCVGNDQEEEPG